jgi:hypothetical protein
MEGAAPFTIPVILKIPLHYCVFLGFNSAGDPTAELEMKKSSY